MFEKIRSFFYKEENNKITASELFEEEDIMLYSPKCSNCMLKGYGCKGKFKKSLVPENPNMEQECVLEEPIKKYDKNKDSFLIIDDNEGMVSFLEDDLLYIDSLNAIDLSNINLLTLSGNYAAFILNILLEREKGLNIKWAIIDITLGGSIMAKDGNIKYNGVDVYEMLIKYNPDLNFIFYTGNSLNPYIKRNKILIDRFEKISSKSILDYVLFKTSVSIQDRRKFFAKKFFDKEIG